MVDPATSVRVAATGRTVVGEELLNRAEPPVWAYCRELCGPVACERAAAETIAALANGAQGALGSKDALLRLTRLTAAREMAAVLDAQPGRASAHNRICSLTPERLVAAAQDDLEPNELRELGKHLQTCLVCKSAGFKMNRAERVFTVMYAGLATTAPDANGAAAAAEPARASVAEAAPVRAPEPQTHRPEPQTHRPEPQARPAEPQIRPPETEAREPDSPRARAAVLAYCSELCGTEAGDAAVAESLAAHRRMGGDPSDFAALLRTTRTVAALYMPRSDSRKRNRTCGETPARLAAAANGELRDKEERKLADHLARCMACQAMEFRMIRAERAFAALAGISIADEAVKSGPRPVAPLADPAVPDTVRKPAVVPVPAARTKPRAVPIAPAAAAAAAAAEAETAQSRSRVTKPRPIPAKPEPKIVEREPERRQTRELGGAAAAGAAAAGAAAAGSAAADAAARNEAMRARAKAPAPATYGGGDQAATRRRLALAIAAIVVILLVIPAVLVFRSLSGTTTSHARVTASNTRHTPAATATTPAAPAAAKPKAAKPKAAKKAVVKHRAVAHRTVAKPHHAATKPHHATVVATITPPASTPSSNTTSTPATPARTVTHSTPPPVVTHQSPPPPTHSAPPPSPVTQQGGGLGTQTTPQQGIGGSG